MAANHAWLRAQSRAAEGPRAWASLAGGGGSGDRAGTATNTDASAGPLESLPARVSPKSGLSLSPLASIAPTPAQTFRRMLSAISRRAMIDTGFAK